MSLGHFMYLRVYTNSLIQLISAVITGKVSSNFRNGLRLPCSRYCRNIGKETSFAK